MSDEHAELVRLVLGRMNIGDKVSLYNGEGGRGTVVQVSDGTALVHFADGAKVWCANRNLTRLEAAK